MDNTSPKSLSSRFINAVVRILKKSFGHTKKGVTETIFFIRKELPSSENSGVISTEQKVS